MYFPVLFIAATALLTGGCSTTADNSKNDLTAEQLTVLDKAAEKKSIELLESFKNNDYATSKKVSNSPLFPKSSNTAYQRQQPRRVIFQVSITSSPLTTANSSNRFTVGSQCDTINSIRSPGTSFFAGSKIKWPCSSPKFHS